MLFYIYIIHYLYELNNVHINIYSTFILAPACWWFTTNSEICIFNTIHRLLHITKLWWNYYLYSWKRRTSRIAEVPNSGKILLYWLFRSKIWYFRVIWLFTANFFKKLVFFLCFLEGRGKKSKQNDTAWFSPNSLVFSSFRYCASLSV